MKKVVRLVFGIFLFACFLVKVDAETVLSINIAPKFNTDIKNGNMYITVSDASGIDSKNIKLYKVDKNKKVISNVSFKSINSTKTGNVGTTEYEGVVSSSYLKDSINYFYVSVTDKSGLKNDSYFRVTKKKDGSFSRYFAPKVGKFEIDKDGKKINFTITDSGKIKNLIIKDLNGNKNVKILSGNSSINDSVSLSSFVASNKSRRIEVYTEDEEGNTARRVYSVNETVLKNTVAVKEPAPVSKDKVLKVLLIGNSYTYYNDYGGILAELARKQGRKLIVVNAVHGGRDVYCIDALKVSIYAWDNRKNSTLNKKHNNVYPTSLLQKLNKKKGLDEFQRSKDTVKDYNLKLKDAINYDWGSLGRAGKWDYVVLQNHYKGEMGALKKAGISVKTYCDYGTSKRKSYEKNDSVSQYVEYSNKSNLMIYDMVKNGISDKSKFIILRTFATDWPSHTSSNNYMKQSAAANGFSFVDTRMLAKKITGSEKKDRLENFTTLDSSEHPAPRGAYLMATAIYSRIYGRSELASSEKDSNYIKLYNIKKDSFEGAVTQALFSTGGGKTVTKNGKKTTVYNTAKPYAMSVDDVYARKIQSTVYNNYSSYIKDCGSSDCSVSSATYNDTIKAE